MRSRWRRLDEQIALSSTQLTAIIQPAFPGQAVVASQPTQGGQANTNIRLELSQHPEPILLRLYTREAETSYEIPRSATKEAALHGLLATKLPVPHVLFTADQNPVTGHPYMLREWVPGERLEVVAHALCSEDLVGLGQQVGAILAGIHSVTFPAGGYLDESLNVVTFPHGVPGDTFAEFLDLLLGSRGKDRLGPALTQALMAFAEREARYGATWSGPPCLTHADFGGSNILVQVGDGGARVAAVVDWEFAFAGTPFIDLGNLMRPPLGELPGFEAAVAYGYRAEGGPLTR